MANRIPREFIDDVIARTNIVEIIQSRVGLKKTGRDNYSACCPFHDEKTPSFTVSATKQFYYCFGCHASGNVISFLMEYERLTFIEALESLAQSLGLELPASATATDPKEKQHQRELIEILTAVNHYYQQQLRQHTPAIEYLKSRHITGQTAKTFNLGYAPTDWHHLAKQFTHRQQALLSTQGLLLDRQREQPIVRFRDRIMFPIRNTRGQVVAFGGRTMGKSEQVKYLNSPETPIFHKSNELYGLYELLQQRQRPDYILLVEGYMDVISLHEHGIPWAVAALGTASNPRHVQKLLRYCQEVVFCFDGDRAGREAAWRALAINLPVLRDGVRLRFLFLPDKEDPDTWVQTIGKDAFEQQIANADSLQTVFFAELSRRYPPTSLENRAQLAKEANTHLATMPKGVFRELLYRELAEQLGMSVEALAALQTSLHATKPKPAEPTSQPSRSPLAARRPTPTEWACALLLHHPHLVEQLEPRARWAASHDPGLQLLNTLLLRLKTNPLLNTGQLLDADGDSAQHEYLVQIAAIPMLIPDTGIEAEFLETIHQVRKQDHRQRIEQLIEKAKQDTLTETEEKELNLLLAEKAVD